MNLKMFLYFLIMSSSPTKAIISPNTHLDERDARIFNFPHCFLFLSMRNVSYGVTSRACKEHCFVARNHRCLTRKGTAHKKQHKCGELSWHVVFCQPERAAAVHSHHIQRHLSPQKPENTRTQRFHYLVNATTSPWKRMDKVSLNCSKLTQLEAFYSAHQTFFHQDQVFPWLIRINSSWWAPKQHSLKRGGGSGGNLPAVWLHHVFSTHAGSRMRAAACR